MILNLLFLIFCSHLNITLQDFKALQDFQSFIFCYCAEKALVNELNLLSFQFSELNYGSDLSLKEF